MSTHIWLRAETKQFEKRTVLTPDSARRLAESGFRLTVERSSQSVFSWQEYAQAGCEVVEENAWIEQAPMDAIILGLKELAANDFPLRHRHIHFAHVYKSQAGWERVLNRFQRGGGVLYDLEYLVDESGKRVAAFGYWAGFAGAGLAMLAWCNVARGVKPVLGPVRHRPDQSILIDEVRRGVEMAGRRPRALVIGALGRCGRGAIELLERVGVDVVGWDQDETRHGGPFEEILDCDVFLNCVFVEKSIRPFLTRELLLRPARKLKVVCDVSCDPYGDYNPLPVYDRCTTFSEPLLEIVGGDNELFLIAIDHLPSMLPKESSENFCGQLMPYLLQLDKLDQGVWKRASDLFYSKSSMVQVGA